ncbi:VOC family protein [Nocardioides sp.]|uniref:VOC family protein n=1 Tax=Nocardioides sp. TaxID=35761 RepID=UPI003784D614
MGSELHALCFEAVDPGRLGRFWSQLLGWVPVDERDGGVAAVPEDGTPYRLRFVPGASPKSGRNRIHLDLTTEDRDQRELVARALELGGSHLDVGQGPDEDHVVLADPEGNELCVIEPGNGFLAGCGRIGAINCEGTRAVGLFWSAALDWPLVWDQDEETAIQSPRGGTKITWSGPPLPPQTGSWRLRLQVRPGPGQELPAEVDRLVGLGARRVGRGPDGSVTLADPDGNELWVLPTSAAGPWSAW